jgi:DSF synthase
MSKQANVTALHSVSAVTIHPEFTQLSTRYEAESQSIWCWLKPTPRPCLNPVMLGELTLLQQQLNVTHKDQHADFIWPLRHLVLASKTPGVYNLGGDLELFKHLIISRNRDKLTEYATGCINLLHQYINNPELPISTVALVQGHALGGGFEAALSCDVIIAERGAQMGFPEIMFNLFPGMGAYNFLARRVNSGLAERIILSGKTYRAEELYEMGVIDVLAEPGKGELTTKKHLKTLNRSHKTLQSMKKVRHIINPLAHDDLIKIVEIWVDNAMDLSAKDISRMDKLLYAQKKLSEGRTNTGSNVVHIPRKGDWRKLDTVTFPLTTHLGEQVLSNRRQTSSRRRASS